MIFTFVVSVLPWTFSYSVGIPSRINPSISRFAAMGDMDWRLLVRVSNAVSMAVSGMLGLRRKDAAFNLS